MAVDFYHISDKAFKNRLFSFDDNDFEKLQPVLSQFKNLTGLVIDQYDDTRVSYDHIKLIIKLIDVQLSNIPSKDLSNIKDKFLIAESDVIAIGD